MEKRIKSAQIKINALNESNAIFISDDYAKLKLQELYLAHECRETIKKERDERVVLFVFDIHALSTAMTLQRWKELCIGSLVCSC